VITPTQDYRRTTYPVPPRPLTGLDAWVDGAVGRYRRRGPVATALHARAEAIDARANDWRDLTDHHLHERLDAFRREFRRGRKPPAETLEAALAALREIADRRLGLRPYPVQLMGALALHRGFLAEMATGEGKTLTAGLAAVLAGWTALPCHIITANDYLVQRDAEWLRPLYRFCDLKVGFVTAENNPRERRIGYDCDITYTTSKEIVADFLRDRLHLGTWHRAERRLIQTLLNPRFVDRTDLVMRGLHTAIVDEADCLMVDEAVTPLIISAAHENDLLRNACRAAQDMAAQLEAEEDYRVNLRYHEVELTDLGRKKIENRSDVLPNLFRSLNRQQELVRQALTARELYLPGKQYLVVEGKVVIVDEFTGRIMPQRTWRAGLHQAIEAKEGLDITDPTETLARLSFQRFFRLYRHLAGMTGTAREASAEFWQVYHLPFISVPTNEPCRRTVWPDRIFAEAEPKWQAIVQEIERLHVGGRPLLVGTRSVEASEHLARLLNQRGLDFRLLNALRHREEAQIVAEAGHGGRITIATNMAGRGTDIRLAPGVAELGGLHVIATERHEAHRIDRQLFGRSARQGDLGSAQAFVSLDDELVRRFLPRWVRLPAQRALKRGQPGAQRLAASLISLAQRRAERQAYHQRRSVLRTDTWLDEALSFAGPDVG
jgi:preprotein translocase subunit SecA